MIVSQNGSSSLNRQQKWDARYAAQDLVWSAGPNDLFALQVKDLSPGTALDVACGEGRNALWLAELGWHVTGIDFSGVAIGKARQIAEHRGVDVAWQVADIAAAEIPGAAFDLVLVAYVHTDLQERAAWLPKVIDAVKPGGLFIYIGHDPSNIEHGVGGPSDAAFLPGVQDIVALLDGFCVEVADVVERPVAADPGHGGEREGAALDTFVRAARAAPG